MSGRHAFCLVIHESVSFRTWFQVGRDPCVGGMQSTRTPQLSIGGGDVIKFVCMRRDFYAAASVCIGSPTLFYDLLHERCCPVYNSGDSISRQLLSVAVAVNAVCSF